MLLILADSLASYSESFVLVLGHTLWQAALVAFLVWVALRLLPARAAEVRYKISTAGLMLVVILPFATWSVLRLDPNSPDNHWSAPATPFHANADLGATASVDPSLKMPSSASGIAAGSTSSPTFVPNQNTITMGIFLSWFCIATLLLVRGLAVVAIVRCRMTIPMVGMSLALAPLQAITRDYCQLLRLRRTVRLIVSDRISVPAVIGTVWPVILIPAAMLTGVPVDQWRIVIAHELAHIRRWDALVAIAQMVIESMLFFNPAVWWLSRQLRVEREACCDGVAVQLCGQPLSVARALVEVAAASLPRRSPRELDPTVAAALAFVEPTHRGELTNRVQRLVAPDRSPGPRVSWIGLVSLLLILVVLGVGLKLSSDLAVQTAAHWMSPRERVDKLVQLEAEQNGNFVPLENAAGDSEQNSGRSIPEEQAEHAQGWIPVELVVRTDDGSPLERQLQLQSLSQTGHSSTGKSLNSPREPVNEYRAALYYPPCRFRIAAGHPGRAPVVSPVVSLLPGDPGKTVELVLTKGSTVPALIQDHDGRPIPHARLRGNVQISIGGSSTGISIGEYESDDDGRLQLRSVGPSMIDFEILAGGFQRQRIRHEFATDLDHFTMDKPLVVRMESARPTKVLVVDGSTGQPLPHVRFTILQRKHELQNLNFGYSSKYNAPDRWMDYATSNEKGIATFDELEDAAAYTFVATVPHYPLSQVVVSAGDPERTVKLGPSVRLTGQITGHRERLRSLQRDGKTVYVVDGSRLLGNYSDNLSAELDDEGRFSFPDLTAGDRITLLLPDNRQDIVINPSGSNLEYHIPAANVATPPMREVIIHLTGTAPGADARGSLYVSWQHPTLNLSTIQNGPLPLSGNEVRFKAPIGAKINFLGRDLVGYRIHDQTGIEVTGGTEPHIINVPVTPVGGIYGSVTRHDGTPTDAAFVMAIAAQRPAGEKSGQPLDPSGSSAGSKYLCSVPLGGRYRLFAREQTASSYLWGVSEEVTIDQAHPIAQVAIQLPAGREVRVRLLDTRGQPIAKQSVKLEIGVSVKGSAGFSFQIDSETSADGFASFGRLPIDHPVAPINISYHVIVPPQKYRGISREWNPRQPLEIRLQTGVSASGVVIDTTSGKPIPNANVRIYPLDAGRASYKGSVTTTADGEGRFRFDGLEQILYAGSVTNAAPKGTVVEPLGHGGYRFSYPNGPTSLELTGGAKDVARWEVVIYPGRSPQGAE